MKCKHEEVWISEVVSPDKREWKTECTACGYTEQGTIEETYE